MSIESLEAELSGLEPREALAILEKLQEKRVEQNFVAYWKPYSQGRQPEIFEKFTPDIKIFGVLGGNRSGKSEVGAAITAAWALGKDYFQDEPGWSWVQGLPIPEPPNTIWVVGLDFPTVRDVLWREKLRFGKDHPGFVPSDPQVVKKTNDSDYQIFFANGSVITCKSADSGREKFQGASVDLIWIDEEPEVEIFDECYQRTVDCAGKILITLTPLIDISSGTRTPWVFDLYEDWKRGQKDIQFISLSVLDNPYVPESEKVKLKEKWAGHVEEGARLYGEFVQRSGLVYPMWDPAKHILRRPPGGVPKGWRRIACIDPAATGTTAVLWAAIAPTGDIHLYREYYERNRVVSDHAKSILILNQGDPVDIWLIDPKWGTQRNAETHKTNMQLYRDAGIPVRLAQVGEDYGLNASREYLQATVIETASHPRLYAYDTLSHFKFEITHYVWDFFAQGEQKGLSKDKPRKRDDHLMNAMQYICAMHPHGRRSHDAPPPDPRTNSYT